MTDYGTALQSVVPRIYRLSFGIAEDVNEIFDSIATTELGGLGVLEATLQPKLQPGYVSIDVLRVVQGAGRLMHLPVGYRIVESTEAFMSRIESTYGIEFLPGIASYDFKNKERVLARKIMKEQNFHLI